MAHAYLTSLGWVQVIQRCTKVPFASRREAFKAARESRNPVGVVQRGYGRLGAYRCFCGAYHLGHFPGKGEV